MNAEQIWELFFPPRCLLCGEILAIGQGKLCSDCQMEVQRREGRLLFSPQTQQPEGLEAGFAVFYYEESKEAIWRFKFHGAYRMGEDFGRLMAEKAGKAGSLDLAKAQVVIPVPVHRQRLRLRGFNQAALLARPVAAVLKVPMSETLCRIRHTKAQMTLGDQQRQENVHHAFAVVRPEEVRDKRVLLIDDIYTTGATASSCALALRQAGASSVSVLALAAGAVRIR